jgi:hypothetical protein
MSPAEMVRTIRENSAALRRVAARITVTHDDEESIRAVAASLDELALEISTKFMGVHR